MVKIHDENIILLQSLKSDCSKCSGLCCTALLFSEIDGFPESLATELKHCILAHHGELEYGSPKKPALMEAVALNLADNTDAKMQTFTELLMSTAETGWLGYNRLFESNLRMTRMEQ